MKRVIASMTCVIGLVGCEATTGTVSLAAMLIDPATWENVLKIVGIVTTAVEGVQ